MPIYTAIFLGILQGLTEFLPVSSSGHLIAMQKLLNMPENMMLFNIIMHLATLCAVIIVFRKKIMALIRQPFCKTNICLVISTIVTCVIVLIFKDLIDRTITYKVLPITFFITAILLILASIIKTANKKITARTSIIAGLAQGVAVVPGFSRSGFTISACLACGTQRNESAEYSFLMSIPIIVASFVYELASEPVTLSVGTLPLCVAFITALICGIVAITMMLAIVRNIKLYYFSIYLIILSMFLAIIF